MPLRQTERLKTGWLRRKRSKWLAWARGFLFVSQIGLIVPVWAETDNGKTVASPPPVITTNADERWIHGFVGETIANKNFHYSHGINNGDNGPYYQTDLILFLTLYKGDGFINQVNLNSFTWYQITSSLEVPPSHNLRRWNEFDANPMLDIKFLKNFDLEVTSLNYLSPNDAFSPIHEVEFQLSYDDTSILGPWALHPSFTYQKDISGVGAIKGNGSLFEFILTPGVTLIKDGLFPVKLDFPLSVGLGDKRFFGGDTFGYFAATVQSTVGLGFVPKKLGSWAWTTAASFFTTNECGRGKKLEEKQPICFHLWNWI